MVDGVNFFNQNQEIKLQNRGARSSGITFELKSVFEDLVNKGVIRDKDGKGLTKADALNLFNKLDSIHKNTNRATNYTSMQAGQSFTYSAAEMKALAEAAGYEIVNSGVSPAGEKPELDKGEVNPLDIAKPHTPPENLVLSAGVKQAISEQTLEISDAKTFTRDVNGEKQKIAVLRDENGNKIRRLINEDGSFGETLVTVSTMGKNKYVTQSKFEADVRKMLGLGANDEIPSDLKAEYVTIGGESSLVIKKDGKIMDSAQIRAYMAEYKANDNRGVDAFDNSFDATGREQMGTSDNTVRDDSQNVLSKIPDAKLPDGSTWDGNVMEKQLSQDQKDANKLVYEFVRKSARFYNSKNGLYTVRGFQGHSQSSAETKAEYAMRRLCFHRNDYMRLKQQEPSTLTQSDKNLINNFEATLEKMQLQVDENGNFSNIKGSDFIRE